MKKNKFTLNVILNAILQSFNYIIPLITTPYISRILGAELLGKYSYYNSLISYFVLFITFGFTNYGIREIAARKSNKEARSQMFIDIMLSKGLLTIISAIVYFSLLFTIWRPTQSYMIMAPMGLFLIGSMMDVTFFFQGVEEYKAITIRTVIIKTIFVILTFVLVKSTNDFYKYIYLQIFASVLSSVIMLVSLKGKITFKGMNYNFFYKQIYYAFPYFLPSIAYLSYGLLDKTMIGIFSTSTNNGYYEQMTKLVNLITISIGSVSPIILSKITILVSNKEGEEDYDEINKTISLSFKIVNSLAIPAIFGLIIIGDWLVPAFFGEEFVEALPSLYALLPLILTTTLGWLIDAIYFTPKKNKKVFNIIIISKSVINLFLNVVFIKQFGALGAALASSISDFIGLILYIIFSSKFINYKLVLKSIYKFLIAALVMLVIGYSLTFVLHFRSLINIIICILVCVTIYVVLLFVLREELIINKFKHKRNAQ